MDGVTARTLRRTATFTGLGQPESIKVEEQRPSSWNARGVQRTIIDDFTHYLFEWDWSHMLTFVGCVYLGIILLFASLLQLMAWGQDLTTTLLGDIPPDMSAYEVFFWFSAINLITSGYGDLVPGTRASYLVSTVEQCVGILLSSLLLGIVVSRASIPTAKLVFAKVAVVRLRYGVPHIIFRVGNARGNFLWDPQIQLSYVFWEASPEGEIIQTEHSLEVQSPIAMKPVAFLSHRIDSSSPLYGKSQQDLLKERGFLVISLSAVDDQTLQTLHSRMLYHGKAIRFGHAFEDVVKTQGPTSTDHLLNLCLDMDFTRFHCTTPLKAEDHHQVLGGQDAVRRSTTSASESSKIQEASATFEAGMSRPTLEAPQAPQSGLSDDDVSRLAAALLLKLQGTSQSPAEASLVKEISAELQDPPDQPTKASAGIRQKLGKLLG